MKGWIINPVKKVKKAKKEKK